MSDDHKNLIKNFKAADRTDYEDGVVRKGDTHSPTIQEELRKYCGNITEGSNLPQPTTRELNPSVIERLNNFKAPKK